MPDYSPSAIATKRRSLGRGLADIANRIEELSVDLNVISEEPFVDAKEKKHLSQLAGALAKVDGHLRTMHERMEDK